MTSLFKFNDLNKRNIDIPVVGIMCGMDATKNIKVYTQYNNIVLIPSDVNYHVAKSVEFYGIVLNPTYEAKCVQYLQDGDLFYIVA